MDAMISTMEKKVWPSIYMQFLSQLSLLAKETPKSFRALQVRKKSGKNQIIKRFCFLFFLLHIAFYFG